MVERLRQAGGNDSGGYDMMATFVHGLRRGGRAMVSVLLLLVLLPIMVACTQTIGAGTPGLAAGSLGRTSVLLMPLDVEMYELTAGGVPEPKADWTAAAKAAVDRAVTAQLNTRASRTVRYGEADRPSDAETQILKLHEAVGKSILEFKVLAQFELPSKQGQFDWTLGRDASALRDRYGTDYALFVFARDSLATAARKAAGVLLALLGGGYKSGGTMTAFASLVDLRSGDVVWFNVASRKVGDLRDHGSAHTIVETMLDDFPIGIQ